MFTSHLETIMNHFFQKFELLGSHMNDFYILTQPLMQEPLVLEREQCTSQPTLC